MIKPRTLAVAGAFARCSVFCFAVAWAVLGLQFAVNGACACIQSERED